MESVLPLWVSELRDWLSCHQTSAASEFCQAARVFYGIVMHMSFTLCCYHPLPRSSPPVPFLLISPSPPPIIISSTFMSYVSCCFSGLRFRSARSPMAGEELQPLGRALTQEAEGPGTVQSTVPEWLEAERARGSKGCFVFSPFTSATPPRLLLCHHFGPLYYLYQIRIAGRVPTRQLKSFATFIF